MENLNFKNFLKTHRKIIVITAIIIIMIAVIVALFSHYQKNRESSIFKVKNIIFYNSATLINNSSAQSLDHLSICQFSDFSIFIDNGTEDSELSNANTLKKLYIDNISISSKTNNGTQILNYKNPYLFGKYNYLYQPDKNRINFNIISSNLQNNTTDYNQPTFYTDCSNPITLGYLNDGIVQNYSVSDNSNTVSYNAKVLKEANINLDDINNTLNFTIHIVNNENHKFSCHMSISLPLDEDFLNNGYSYINIPVSGDEYKFYRD